jgi:hypothetical protein
MLGSLVDSWPMGEVLIGTLTRSVAEALDVGEKQRRDRRSTSLFAA